MTEPTPPSTELGSLGIAHLKRLWFQRMANLAHSSRNGTNPEWPTDKLLIHGIGVGLEQMTRFLSSPRSIEELENWILELNGGPLEPARVRKLNAALLSLPYDSDVERGLAEIDNSPNVFTSDDLERWNRDGFVVLRDAICPEEGAAVVRLVYDTIEGSPDRAETWYARPNTQGIMVQVFQHPALEPARRSARIHKAFAQLWGSVDLFSTTDRCGFNPPENDRFTFSGPYLHWDLDLRDRPIPFGLAGVLYLTDTDCEQGAFTCIPGFHLSIEDWLSNLPSSGDPRDHLPAESAKAIPGQAGDLIIWHQALPHGSRPNRSNRPRVVQYVKMFPPPRQIPKQLSGRQLHSASGSRIQGLPKT